MRERASEGEGKSDCEKQVRVFESGALCAPQLELEYSKLFQFRRIAAEKKKRRRRRRGREEY